MIGFRGGGTAATLPEVNLKTLRRVEAACEPAKTGRALEIPA